jgi:hypothetical protein
VAVLYEFLKLWDIVSDITVRQTHKTLTYGTYSPQGSIRPNRPMTPFPRDPPNLAHGRGFGNLGCRASAASSYCWKSEELKHLRLVVQRGGGR